MPSSDDLDSSISRAIDWRMAEVKLLVLHANSCDAIMKDIMYQLTVARLYAHLEGGVKEIVNLYLNWIDRRQVKVSDLRSEMKVWRMSKEFRARLESLSNAELIAVGEMSSDFWASSRLKPIAVSREYSSMTHEALTEIYKGLGLCRDHIALKRPELYLLHNRRNPVAHGEPMSAEARATYQSMLQQMCNLVSETLYDLSIQLIGQSETSEYLEAYACGFDW